MYRLRKKSDTKRSQVPEPLRVKPPPPEPLPSLPPADDFRTSLILPDLTRRFSLLRSSSGSPIPLDDLKSKFAEQRARGSQNQVTEEEEDMILEVLERLHAKTARTRASNSGEEADNELGSSQTESQDLGTDGLASPTMGTSLRSSSTATSSVLHTATSISSFSSAKGSHHSRRLSNNLFGSGKFRDQAYLRNQTRRGGREKSAISVTPSESMSTIASVQAGNVSIYSDNQSLRPSTPEGSTYSPSTSAPSSPNNDKTFERQRIGRSTPIEARSDYKIVNTRLSKTMSPEGLKRASMALDEVIRELEEEGDDEIVMERSPIAHGYSNSLNAAAAAAVGGSPLLPSTEHDTGTALSSDDRVAQEDTHRSSPYPRSRTTSPTPRLPGYIPGMPRPMTPRDPTFDSDDQTPSTTPRAVSPRLPVSNPPYSVMPTQSIVTTVQRSNSNASTARHSPIPGSPVLPSTPPLFFNRSTNGRFTPDDRQRNGGSSPTADVFDSSSQVRRRPISPLSGPTFQPLAGTPPRPSTPSNVTWNTSPTSPKALGRNESMTVHSRNGSSTSIPETNSDALERSKSTSRSVRSPALPDYPWVDHGLGGNVPPAQAAEDRPPSAMSGVELGSPLQISGRPLRSPTPTHNRRKSTTSPSFPEHANPVANGDGYSPSRRSSKQNHHSSFSLGSSHGLLLSPIANSSRSSMESAGSSYHSWDDDHKKDRLFGLFTSLDQQYSDWHDVSGVDKSSSSTPGTSPYEGLDVEDVVRRQTGLTKGDFLAIQDKLVSAALTKAVTPDGRNRVSSLRRRRPSTSQSHYSVNGTDNKTVSSTPQPQGSVDVAASRAVDHIAKASALLDSVVDSIESPRVQTSLIPDTERSTTAVRPPDSRLSSPGRRNRALADALFGSEDKERPATPAGVPSVNADDAFTAHERVSKPAQEGASSPVFTQGNMPNLSPSDPRLPTMLSFNVPRPGNSPHVDAAQLAVEVRQKAEAATAALRKSPSIPKIGDGNGSIPRKRINPSQISSPTLVSASTSVDTIPLPSPPVVPGHPNGSSSRIGMRFRKLRGTLRAKTPVPGLIDDITPYPTNLRPPHSAPAPMFSPPSPPIQADPVITSASQSEQIKMATYLTTSPPASATPGLKGFMARFRKQRAADSYPAPQRQRSALASSTASTLSSQPYSNSVSQSLHSAPATRTDFESAGPSTSRSAPAESLSSQSNTNTVSLHSASPQSEAPPHTDETALRQLFDAASNLGLDQAALNDLIARSPSTSSKSTAWTKLTRMGSLTESRTSQVQSVLMSDAGDRTPVSEGRPSMDGVFPRPSAEITEARVRKAPESTLRPVRENAADASLNPVVRRTIIFPSDSRASTVDINNLMRKQRRQSAGANSTSSIRSIHDRVPTPPPHKSVGGRRFSTDTSPPVPQLPPSFSSHADGVLPPGQMEQSNSAYDSLYEMYAGDSRAASANPDVHGGSSSKHPQSAEIPESGPALEVIEMANGETIWSIVNGLRDDDGESFYGDRTSFVSEYSQKDSSSDGLKLFFKGHEKKSSKSSNTSFSTRKKPQYPKGSLRPETKVFFSSSAQIGRLIENLSRGVDAGSFNIAPEPTHGHLGHSTSSSLGSEADMRLTVEERLEHMLGSMGSAT